MAAGQAVKVRGKASTKVTTAQATKNAISTTQLVTQKQSQELAQTLVHGSVRRAPNTFPSVTILDSNHMLRSVALRI